MTMKHLEKLTGFSFCRLDGGIAQLDGDRVIRSWGRGNRVIDVARALGFESEYQAYTRAMWPVAQDDGADWGK